MDFESYVDGGAYMSYSAAYLYYTGALQTVCEHVPAYRWQGVRVLTNKPPCGPKRGHGTPQPRYALECHFDTVAERLGIPIIELRRKNFLEPNTKTVNYLRITSNGLRQCVDIVTRESRFDARHGKLPVGKGIGFAVGAYLCGAGLPLYWNDMPHTSVDIRLDRSGVVTVSCGQLDAGDGRGRGARLSARADQPHLRRDGPHADRSGQLLEPRDLHGGQRGDQRRDAAAQSAGQCRRGRARRSGGRAGNAPRDAVAPRWPGAETDVPRACQAGRDAQWRAHRHRELQASQTGRSIQGLGRGPQSGVQLLSSGSRGRRRS